MKLCITEKPSAAESIAKVIGADAKHNGYYQGGGFIVTWALGHLVKFAEPEAYGYVPQNNIWDKEARQNALDELPLLPAAFITTVMEDKKPQFDIIQQLMQRDDVDLVIDCGDMGPEGHYLQWLIRRQAKCDKPVKRFCTASLTDQAIRDAMDHLREISDFEKIIEGEFCKHKADWVLGMSMSRCCSIKYNGRVDIGRVMTPTLYFVVKRYLDNQKFVAVDYYQIKADLDKGFTVCLKVFTGVSGVCAGDIDTEGRLIDKDAANRIAMDLKTNPNAWVKAFETKKRAADRPQLYDITELQRDGNRIYGYGAADVLGAAQSLYEKKALTYPRTDSRYITGDLREFLQQRINDLAGLKPYKEAAGAILEHGPNIDKKIVDDSKVTDHHALIVTELIKDFDTGNLSKIESDVLHLVISRMLVSLAQKYVYDETVVVISCCGGQYELTAKGKKPVSDGFKRIENMLVKDKPPDTEPAGADEPDQTFPQLEAGQPVHIERVTTVKRRTEAPKLHTEATLLTAMENAGSYIENGGILKGKGIGTQATRAGIIQKLFDIGYIVNKAVGKVNFIEPTKQGISCVKVLPPELYSPKITADWETKIAAIIGGGNTAERFMDELKQFIAGMIKIVMDTNVAGVYFGNKESIGVCPFCGKGEVYAAKIKSPRTNEDIEFVCCGEKCGFALYADISGFYNNTGRNLLKKQIRQLIENGSITAKTKTKDKDTGQPKSATFELQKNNAGRAVIKCVYKK